MLRFVCPLVLLVAASGAVAGERPNIVFIYTDDQAPTAVGLDTPELKTPNLDRLFRGGVRLTNAFTVTPVCSPSRAELMTSRYGSELGILDWINPRAEPDHGLDPKTITWPEVLSEAGYDTGLVGKWHLGTADRFHPTKTGFGYFMGFRGGGTSPKNPTLEKDGETRKFEGFTADVLTDHALEFLRRKRSQPFLLCLHFRAPHSAWLPVREEDWAPYASLDPTLPEPDFPKLNVKKVKRMTREYYASVTSVDRNVGRVLDLLDEMKVADNTVVVFSSDHGYHNGHHGLWFKGNAIWQLTELPPQRWPNIIRSRRPNMFDQALRVPTAIRWPGVVQPGSKLERTVTNLDWFPTLLQMAGAKLPATKLHGRSIVPLLRGEGVEWDDEFYAEYSMRHQSKTDMRAWRTPEWKLMIDFANENRAELYDLKRDPGETTNLVDSTNPEVVAVRERLRARLLSRMEAIGDFARPE